MEEYVITNAESEGHFDYFSDRKAIWDQLKTSDRLSNLMITMVDKLEELKGKYTSSKKPTSADHADNPYGFY